jgi:hypothetical protein
MTLKRNLGIPIPSRNLWELISNSLISLANNQILIRMPRNRLFNNLR